MKQTRSPRRAGSAALVMAATAAILASGGAAASTWSDTSLSWRYGTDFREPTDPNKITKNIYGLTHASGYKYGINFFNVDLLASNSKDPGANNTGGAHEAYVVYRNTVDLGAVSGAKLGGGPIRSYGATIGFDWNAKQDFFGSAKRMLVIGPTVMFEVPGFLQFSILAAKERGHTNIPGTVSPSGDVSFKTYAIFDVDWGIGFSAGPVPVKFGGYAAYNTAKGADEFGGGTRPEIHTDFSLMFDVGALFGVKDTFKVGPEYEYWHNKFGNLPGVGTTARTPMIRAEYHF